MTLKNRSIPLDDQAGHRGADAMADFTLRPIDPIHVATDDVHRDRSYQDQSRRNPRRQPEAEGGGAPAKAERIVECQYDEAGDFEGLDVRDRATGRLLGHYSMAEIQRLKAEARGVSQLFERRG